MNETLPVIFVVAGASGDLATRKILPALFALDARGFLPGGCRFWGYGRTALSDDAFRARIGPQLKCEEIAPGPCSLNRADFLERCRYRAGSYDPAGLAGLAQDLAQASGGAPDHRVFYLAVPPDAVGGLVQAIGKAGLVRPPESVPWTRVVIEKPFGRDRDSSDALTRIVRQVFAEDQTYRIDHYLGKEVIQDLMVLRFANTVFEPLWNRQYLRHVHVTWSENLSLRGRAGYFDGFGIVRDVMQNHLTQILALVAMESPWEPSAAFVRDEKVRVLRQVPPLRLEDVVIGQYARSEGGEADVPGYREEPGVPPDSRTATYAAAVLWVKSPRWRGVPFLLTAGKGLGSRMTEIRLHFREPENDWVRLLQAGAGLRAAPNELVIRVQPEEQIFVQIVKKTPGQTLGLGSVRLDLRYRETYNRARIADAYENLLLDVVRGDRSLFIRDDELEASWDIFTPALRELEERRVAPEPYAFGSSGPAAVDRMAARYGIEDARLSAARADDGQSADGA